MKFTEEQYQNIIKAWQSENTYVHKTEAVIDYLVDDLNVDVTLMGDETLSLANPLTREWAHDKFVEKEKKYYWTGSKEDNIGFVKRLYKDDDGMIVDHGIRNEDTDKVEDEQLTESEIKEWGYNPEMFDREEIK